MLPQVSRPMHAVVHGHPSHNAPIPIPPCRSSAASLETTSGSSPTLCWPGGRRRGYSPKLKSGVFCFGSPAFSCSASQEIFCRRSPPRSSRWPSPRDSSPLTLRPADRACDFPSCLSPLSPLIRCSRSRRASQSIPHSPTRSRKAPLHERNPTVRLSDPDSIGARRFSKRSLRAQAASVLFLTACASAASMTACGLWVFSAAQSRKPRPVGGNGAARGLPRPRGDGPASPDHACSAPARRSAAARSRRACASS